MTVSEAPQPAVRDPLALEGAHCARNYHPLPLTVVRAEGAWLFDGAGRRVLDGLAGYSAQNFGHRHPALVDAAVRQLGRVAHTSRAVHDDQLGPFCADLSRLVGKRLVLPMNTGAEAVETAIKTARLWGRDRKGVGEGAAEIVVADGNFHGRTTTIVSFSDEPLVHDGFGPYAPGFRVVPYGEPEAVERAITARTVAVLIEPIQGERGVIVPPAGYLRRLREICDERNVLLIADEIQSGLGRAGATLACEHEGVVPDLVILGKALGGGLVPLSVVVADEDVLGVFRPGQHGSTFGGNALACAVGRAAVALLATGELQERSAALGARALARLRDAAHPVVREVRGRGLWLGIDLEPEAVTARAACERLLGAGVLSKETHGQTIRFSPPLVIGDDELEWALDRLDAVLSDLGRG